MLFGCTTAIYFPKVKFTSSATTFCDMFAMLRDVQRKYVGHRDKRAHKQTLQHTNATQTCY